MARRHLACMFRMVREGKIVVITRYGGDHAVVLSAAHTWMWTSRPDLAQLSEAFDRWAAGTPDTVQE